MFAQEGATIKFKDFHTSNVTKAVISEDNTFFISADQSGKILMYNTSDYSYEKTLKPSSITPVEKLKLFRNDSIIAYTQKYYIDDKTIDSLYAIRLFDKKEVFKTGIQGNTFIEQQDDVLMISSYNGYVHIIEFFNRAFQPIAKAYPTHETNLAAIDKNLTYVAFVNASYGRQMSLQSYNLKNTKDTFQLDIPEGEKIKHLFYDKYTDELFSVHINSDKNILSIYNLTNNQSFTAPVFSVAFDMGNAVNISNNWDGENYKIVISYDSTLPYHPLLINKKGRNFSSEYITLKNGAVNSLILKEKNRILFFEPFNPNFSSVATFKHYNFKEKKQSESYPNISTNPLNATFLPNNNWMVWGRKLREEGGMMLNEYQVKFYKKGTFNNRFNKLSLRNYLEVVHKTVPLFGNNFSLNKELGFVVFYGRFIKRKFDNVYSFYKYDFIKDEVVFIAKTDGAKTILDYNDTTKTLLLTERRYTNYGHNDPQKLTLLNANGESTFEGLYKFAKISNNGKYILTISDKNNVEIKNLETQKIVFSEVLANGSYSVFKVDHQGFSINNKYAELDFNKCNKTNHLLDVKENEEIMHQKTDCVYVNDIANSSGTVAMIVEELGVFIDNRQLQFSASEFPKNISLSEDASKMMLSFNNGKIKIYNTETLEEMGGMIHPNAQSHIFLDVDGNYFSNVNPDSYLMAKHNGEKVDLKTIDDQFYNPDKVLSLFGTPNETYVSILRKALDLRKNSTESIYQQEEVVGYSSDDIKPEASDLYLLSIGVSDYQQSKYNLTFADKDALDMAFIYDVLDDKTKADYRTKFFGKRILLNNNTTDNKSLKKYYEEYKNVGKLYPLNPERTIWLEHDYGNFSILNFTSGVSKPIEMPKDFKMSSIFEDVVYINPDGLGFYITTEESKFYAYSFKDELFTEVDLTFMNPEKNRLIPLTNNRWLFYSHESKYPDDFGVFHIGNTKTQTIETKRINLNIVEELAANGEKSTDTLDVFSSRLRAVSPNGSHALYTSIDKELFYINLFKENSIPIKISFNGKMDYGTDFYISNDGQTFSLVDNLAANRFLINTYNIEGQHITTKEINGKEDLSYVGFSMYNNMPFWITTEEALLYNNPYDNLETFKKHEAFSFKNVYTKVLTNTDAKSKTIKAELNSFFAKAKPNDQIMLFLAGHGVLNDKLEYNYAPHDMDFVHVNTNGISFNSIIESLKTSPSKNKLLLMDTCHAGNTLDLNNNDTYTANLERNGGERGSKGKLVKSKNEFKLSEVVSLFNDFLSTSGITIISASSGEDVAYENKSLGNGAFTAAYIKLLKQQLIAGTFNLGIEDDDIQKSIILNDRILSEILKEVMITTKGKQQPDLREINKESTLKMW